MQSEGNEGRKEEGRKEGRKDEKKRNERMLKKQKEGNMPYFNF